MDKDLLESLSILNKYQREAVENNDRVLLLNANVGSGKTTVLVHKVMYLYMKKKVPLSQMVVLTFTNKAAEEIKERVISASPQDMDIKELRYFGTFHSVARQLLSNVLPVEDLGYTRDFTILDQNGMQELFENVINNNNLNIKYKKRLEKRLDFLKQGKTLYGNMKYDDEIKRFVDLMKAEKQKRNLMDFDDLIDVCTRLLRNWDPKPLWVIIDEFQDTDDSQLDMVNALIGSETRVFAVGDPNQIIYSWRGSRKDIFNIFKERYNAVEKTLPINYRSTGTILGAARAFLSNPASLEGIRDKGNPIIIRRHYNSFNEALYLADVIKRLHKEGIPYREVAVFYRMQKQSAVFEDVFKREEIPFEVSVRKSLKDIDPLYWFVRVIKASLNPKDADSFNYILEDKKYGPGLSRDEIRKAFSGDTSRGQTLMEKVRQFKTWCRDRVLDDGFESGVYDYFDVDRYLSPTSITYDEDKKYIKKYLYEIKNYISVNSYDVFEGIKNAVDNSMLYGAQIINEVVDPEKECVKLMTLHASKGLEFKYVFISGANYGIIPLGVRVDDEEEKRLFFVGITRAKDCLEISYHSNPEEYNALPEPSPYLRMIPGSLIESDEIKSRAHKLSELRKEIKSNMERKQQEGDTKKKIVYHAKYGEGYIIFEDNDVYTVNFEGYGEKSFSKLFCPLKFAE